MKKFFVLSVAVCLLACGNSPSGPAQHTYSIVREYPHSTASYTQGLFWADGAMYESTGEYGLSSLQKVDLQTGEIVQKVDLDKKFFAEGAAVLNGKIYQLTWFEGKCFVYDASSFKLNNTFDYPGEGWGLTTDGTKLYMSDGTANITVRDPSTFRPERTIIVKNSGRNVQYINELEWIGGHIWANVYMSDTVIVIDPDSGTVEGEIDFSGLTSRLTITPATDVLNGIAHDPATGKIWVTGKNWNKLFEIEIADK